MHGLNLYDYLVRFYEPSTGRFSTVDPLAEKHFAISPYVYCLNNPMRYIDPLGMDTIHINQDGEMVWRSKRTDTDVVYIVDANGNKIKDKKGSFVSVSYNSRVISDVKRGSYAGTNYDRYDIEGTGNATTLFEFLADNTFVEWSHGVFEGNGNTELNALTTSHSSSSEAGASAAFYDMVDNGSFPLISNHSHPRGTRVPSGLMETGYPSGDVIAARAEIRYIQRIDKNRAAPSYNIYLPKNKRQTDQKYFSYSHNWYNLPSVIAP